MTFRGDRTEIGVVREVDLSAITDTYPRSTVADVLSIGATRRFIRTANSLDLLHRFDFASAPKLDRVLVAGNPSPDVTASADQWVAGRGIVAERIQVAGTYPYDATLTDLARRETRPIATWAAAWLEYPTAHLTFEGRDWQFEFIARALGLGVLGVFSIVALGRLMHAVRVRLPHRSAPVRQLAESPA